MVADKHNKFSILSKKRLNYAYHIDAGLYARFLRTIAEQGAIFRKEGKIAQVNTDPFSGDITSLQLEDGSVHQADLFIDCTGFRGLLIEQTLHSGYDDWSHYLPCDSAVAVQTELTTDPVPYTRSIAHESGWQWQIPLQHRMGNGLVFCSRYINDQAAQDLLMSNLPSATINQPRLIKFRTGQRRQHWNKNCIALGLASGFMEPLESTSIHMIQRGIIRLLQMFPSQGICDTDRREFNAQMALEAENIRDFIILHYYVTNRDDSPFWRHCKSMQIPDSLKHRIELFKETGRVFKVAGELFGENSWIQVMLGQGLYPQQYHPVVDMMSESELDQFMQQHTANIDQVVQQLSPHQMFLQHYCPAPSS